MFTLRPQNVPREGECTGRRRCFREARRSGSGPRMPGKESADNIFHDPLVGLAVVILADFILQDADIEQDPVQTGLIVE